jgi:hypothetical protein
MHPDVQSGCRGVGPRAIGDPAAPGAAGDTKCLDEQRRVFLRRVDIVRDEHRGESVDQLFGEEGSHGVAPSGHGGGHAANAP